MVISEQFIQKRRFIIRLGKALHKYGTPAYRLENHLQELSERLGLQSNFMITPTSLTFVLSEEDEEQEYTHIVRVKPGDLDLGSLARMDELVDELVSNKRNLSESIDRLDEIVNKSNPYSRPLMFLAYGGSSAGFATLMHTNLNTIVWSALTGFIIYFIAVWAEKSVRVNSMLEPFVAFIAALLISAAAQFDNRVDIFLVILSSIIVYVPGLALTMGLSELSARHLMSGIARVADAVMSLFKLFFGAFLGLALAKLLWQENSVVITDITPAWTSWIAVAVLSVSLTILFKLRNKDIIWALISSYVAFGASIGGGLFLGPALGGFVGAFFLGIYSNAFSRLMSLPSSIVLLPGLVMLVPGSKVFIGLNQIVSGSTILNMSDVGSLSFLIFMSLVAGLIFSDVVLPSQKRL